ncbi:MAG: DUF5060 domain-containing protein [Chloroflexi bacterium]|nr:DUF5060 domain-containing protein [Chloroflexota bacterium]
MKIFRLYLFALGALIASARGASLDAAPLAPTINAITILTPTVGRYEKFQVQFAVTTVATNLQMPYDPAPPPGITINGITVNAVFTAPSGKIHQQPGFYYQVFDDQIKDGKEWFYPTNNFSWRVRFAPDEIGTWQFYLTARDSGGTVQSTARTFTVTTSTNPGFIRVSPDPRYFEFSDGTYFPALGMNATYGAIGWVNPTLDTQNYFQQQGQNGIQLMRTWLSNWAIFGSTWNPWYGIRNDYDGYLPRAGLITNAASGTPDVPSAQLTLAYAEDASGKNNYWFDACRFIGGFQAQPAVKQNTRYHIKVRYKAVGISGPRNAAFPNYGFVAKVQNPNDGNWHTNCFEPGDPSNGKRVSYTWGADANNWTWLEGEWDSGANNFLPIFYLALENVNNFTATVNGQPYNWHPYVHIDQVFIGEELGNGNYGMNIVTKPSMEHLTYFMERNAYAFDKALELARQNNVYLKLVILDKNEQIENEIGYDGNKASSFDNNNFYGNYRAMTAVRWYQQAWWRYLQARWGYSPNIHSFEVVNEAGPGYTNHYAQVDEMGKFLHCTVFGIAVASGDGQKCNATHPNRHLVSTSFWYGFESGLWRSSNYPNVDYADIHVYIPKDTDPTHFGDTALSTLDLGLAYGAKQSGGASKPIMRGETGLTNFASNTDSYTSDLDADTGGVWLHNLVWGGINHSGLIESYWYANVHIYGAGGDHRGQYKNYYQFIKDVPLNNGNYADVAATVSNPKLRAWGQKDLVNKKAHLWIAHSDHTWRNVVNRVAIAPIASTITIPGFASGAYRVTWWNTNTATNPIFLTQTLTANGSLVLTLPSALSDDVAVKIEPLTGSVISRLFLPMLVR